MAVKYLDKYWLSQSAVFQHKVQASWIAAAVQIKAESPTSVPFHRERERYIQSALANPQALLNAMTLVSAAVATDSNVINDATVAGTVSLTDTTTADIGAGLVTDAHIDAAISGQFNTFFITPDG